MATINELMIQFEGTGSKFIRGLDQIPKDDPRFPEIWGYKCKIQTLFGEWQELLDKWAKEEELPSWLTFLGDLN